MLKRVNEKLGKSLFQRLGVRESDTGLATPSLWDLPADKRRAQEEQTLQVARCTKIIKRPKAPGAEGDSDDVELQYMINVKQIGKFVVGLGKRVGPADVEEGMRVGVDRNK